jgi:hypothetical protein
VANKNVRAVGEECELQRKNINCGEQSQRLFSVCKKKLLNIISGFEDLWKNEEIEW